LNNGRIKVMGCKTGSGAPDEGPSLAIVHPIWTFVEVSLGSIETLAADIREKQPYSQF
jgi:hypothetical protein